MSPLCWASTARSCSLAWAVLGVEGVKLVVVVAKRSMIGVAKRSKARLGRGHEGSASLGAERARTCQPALALRDAWKGCGGGGRGALTGRNEDGIHTLAWQHAAIRTPLCEHRWEAEEL